MLAHTLLFDLPEQREAGRVGTGKRLEVFLGNLREQACELGPVLGR